MTAAPAAFTSPERAGLAAAIAHVADVEAYLARIDAAADRINLYRSGGLEEQLNDAEAVLVSARARRPRELVGALLGEPARDELPDLERAVADAKAALHDGIANKQLLADERRRAEDALAEAKERHKRAVSAALKAAPEVIEVFQRYQAIRTATRDLLLEICAINDAHGTPPEYANCWLQVDNGVINRGAPYERWANAIAALASDPAAALPGG
jgi:hypothetical protein